MNRLVHWQSRLVPGPLPFRHVTLNALFRDSVYRRCGCALRRSLRSVRPLAVDPEKEGRSHGGRAPMQTGIGGALRHPPSGFSLQQPSKSKTEAVTGRLGDASVRSGEFLR